MLEPTSSNAIFDQTLVRSSISTSLALSGLEKNGQVEVTAAQEEESREGAQNDPFGDESGGDVKYKTLKWWQCGAIMVAETISLGILTLPAVLANIGLIGGIIVILGLGAAATYSGYVIGQLKAAHPSVHSIADSFEILFRPFGPRAAKVSKEIGGVGQTLFLIFAMAAHILSWTICLSTLTNSATCTLVWGAVALMLFWICDLPRTLQKMSWMSVVSCASVLCAVLVTMVALGIENPAESTFRIMAKPTVTFQSAFLSACNIVFAFAGHVAFFSFISEMENPKDFPKALALLQITDVSLYLIVAVVCYIYAGDGVMSPALGSAGGIVGKVAWGLAIPTIVIAGVIYGHVSAKYIYVRIFKGTKHMHERSWLAVGSWAGITAALWLVAWIIAESIPNFQNLLGFVAALLASWFTYGVAGVYWLFMNWGKLNSNWSTRVGTVVNIGQIVLAACICFVGLWATGEALETSGSGSVWSCKSNAQF